MALVKFRHLHFPFSKSSSVRLVFIFQRQSTHIALERILYLCCCSLVMILMDGWALWWVPDCTLTSQQLKIYPRRCRVYCVRSAHEAPSTKDPLSQCGLHPAQSLFWRVSWFRIVVSPFKLYRRINATHGIFSIKFTE